jgi:diadenosine tetraphosphate (Ap4A) HIT family hydrolase/SAM-dependent methyltransferase
MCNNCCFCNGKRFETNKEIGVPTEESIIYEDDNVFITPDIAPLIIGHYLIITKKHINSFANADESTYNSLIQAKEYSSLLFGTQELLFFEHGAVIPDTAGICIDHAHMHVLPISHGIINFIDEYMRLFVPNCKDIASRNKLIDCAKKNQPYVFYEATIAGSWYNQVEKLPHQFLRLVITSYLAMKEFRWQIRYKTDESKELFIETLQIPQVSKINKTIEYYDNNTSEYAQRTIDVNMHSVYEYFVKHLTHGTHICDLGCGVGRDSKYFISQGFFVTPIDGSYEMCKLAKEYLKMEVINMKFDEMNFNEEFDAIWACSSLLHVPKNRIIDIYKKLISATKNNGIIYSCFKYGHSEEIEDGRLFSNYTCEELSNLLSGINSLEIVELWNSNDVRVINKSNEWINVIVRVIKYGNYI